MKRGPKPKLTRAQALEIRTSYATGRFGVGTLAARFGVSASTILRIVGGGHPLVSGEPDIARQPGTPVRGKYSLRPPS